MSYAYSNPYATTSAEPRRSTFAAAAGTQGFQILFSGLPDDQLMSRHAPLRSTVIKLLYDSNGRFSGMAFVQTERLEEAESIRQQYSGEVVDGKYRITVQHMLPPNQSYPTTAPVQPLPIQQPLVVAPVPAPRPPPQQPKAKVQKGKVEPPKGPAGKGKPEGLQLLARLSKPGQAKPVVNGHQATLLARQKANIKTKGGRPGDALLSRLAKTPKAKSAKAAQVKAATGTAKVGRAKAKAAKDAMDVDVDLPKGKKEKEKRPKPKTQAELDAEMAMYERQRRFAAAA